jgi:hypothetical protein
MRLLSYVDHWADVGVGPERARAYNVLFAAALAAYLPLVRYVSAKVREGDIVVPPGPLKLVTFLYNVMAGALSAAGFILLIRDPKITAITFFYPTENMLPATRYVTTFFCITKPFEFVDTFLHSALKGKDPSFLHAFHHVATTIASWCTLLCNVKFLHYPAFMNLFVHAIMFAYFAAVALHPSVKRALRPCRPLITFVQVMQMFLGAAYMFSLSIIAPQHGIALGDGEWLCIVYGCAMYAYYIWLFGSFFLDQYCSRREKRA